MGRTFLGVLATLAVAVAVWPLRSAAGAEAEPVAALSEPAADPLVELVSSLEPVVGPGYTVRITGFVDPDGGAGEHAVRMLEASGLEPELERVRRGEMVSRLRVGQLTAADAERLASALQARYGWPAFVTRAP